MTDTKENILTPLYQLGWNRYQIAKELKVSWTTTNMWDRGIYRPNIRNQARLEQLRERGPRIP